MKKLALVALVLAACGGGEKKNNVVLPDAPDNTPDAPPNATCLVSSSLGTVTPTNPLAQHSMGMNGMPPGEFLYGALINADATPDVLQIEFYTGFGAFQGGFPTAATTIQIAGDEANYATCGACVRAFTDIDPNSGESAEPVGVSYFATGGTLQLDSITETSVAGTLSNIQFTHVTIDETTFNSTPVGDGCSSTLTSLAFTADPEPPQAKPNGRSVIRLKNIRFSAAQ